MPSAFLTRSSACSLRPCARRRYRLDGTKICKVYLDPKEAPNVEYKVDTFATVYKKLTGKEVKFEFPTQESH